MTANGEPAAAIAFRHGAALSWAAVATLSAKAIGRRQEPTPA
ncbi:hypothetical protein ABEV74_14305 [Paenibacillus cisolokensis]